MTCFRKIINALVQQKDVAAFPINYLHITSEQNTNQYLKQAIQEAGFDRKVEIIHYQRAKRIKESKGMYEVITFHVSKKTFMTNFLTRGRSLLTAMSITGNKDLKPLAVTKGLQI